MATGNGDGPSQRAMATGNGDGQREQATAAGKGDGDGGDGDWRWAIVTGNSHW